MNRVFIILLICIILYDLYDCDIIEGVAKVKIDDFNKLVDKLAILRPGDGTDDGSDDGSDGGAKLGGTYGGPMVGGPDDGPDDGPMVGNIQLDNKSGPLKNNILDLKSILTLENRVATPSINTPSVTDDQNKGCIIS
jgi:hypothetical protein